MIQNLIPMVTLLFPEAENDGVGFEFSGYFDGFSDRRDVVTRDVDSLVRESFGESANASFEHICRSQGC
jgi:hypothetical protein